ncbi:hypothetical protein [Asticcacaulis sp. W401b]|uniref:hypothetical protein n=1 Tax=Asticcacaulis sp. W401b TaxID=3388666 RepID=UPI0039704D91
MLRIASIVAFLFCVTIPQASAQVAGYSPVRIQADGRRGVGYAVQKGAECLIVTAAHVLFSDDDQARKVTVTDKNQFSSVGDIKVLRSNADRNEDFVVFSVTVPKEFDCRLPWQDGSGLAPRLDQALTDETLKFYIVSLDEGSMSSEPGVLVSQDRKTFKLRASVKQRNSGSPVVFGGNLAGILRSTSTERATAAKGAKQAAATTSVVEIIRQDYLHDQLKDIMKNPGTVILFVGVFSDLDYVRDIATSSARQYFEGQPKIILRPVTKDNLDASGNLAEFGDADFVFVGKVIQGDLTQKKSLASKGKAIGQILGGVGALKDLGNALNAAGQVGEAVEDPGAIFNVTLRVEYTLTNVRTGQSFTELGSYKGEEKGAMQIVLGNAMQKAVNEALPRLAAKAGLVQPANDNALTSAPKVILPPKP